MLEFGEPAAVVIKHTNPCGAATGATIAEAYVRAREADALAAFGGIVGLNRPIDEDTARAIVVDVHRSRRSRRRVDDGARAILADQGEPARGRRRLRVAGRVRRGSGARREIRSMLGALLVQERDQVVEAPHGVAGRRHCAW